MKAEMRRHLARVHRVQGWIYETRQALRAAGAAYAASGYHNPDHLHEAQRLSHELTIFEAYKVYMINRAFICWYPLEPGKHKRHFRLDRKTVLQCFPAETIIALYYL